jgi:hypothetical protein
MIEYKFTDREWETIDTVADQRAKAGRDGYKPGFENLDFEWSWQIGTAGEAAVSRHLALPFYKGSAYKPGHDVGPIEVRSRPQHGQDLGIKDYEFSRFDLNQVFVLCWVTRPTVTIVGWTTVAEVGTRGTRYRDYKLTFMPWEWLHSIHTLQEVLQP